MKISYVGISEKNCNCDIKQRYAQIECNDLECDVICELMRDSLPEFDFDCYADGKNENTVYINVFDYSEYEYFKKWYMQAKKLIKEMR